MSTPNSYFRSKSFRDPLYGFVHLSELETNVIDTEIFRRLQFIKQLSHAYVVYPSAIHTRFEHSLGTSHVSNIMANELGFTEQDDIERVRLSCLLHDIGHGPFSHLFEGIIQQINSAIEDPHEKISQIMIKEDSELDGVLGSKKDEIVELLEKKIDAYKEPRKSLQSDIVSSGIDADKLDYLRRDSYHIGVAYGQFDFSRIIHTLTSTPKGSEICISKKGKDALENYRLARYLMHAQVYTHHARLSADQMFLKALEIAIHDEKIFDVDLLRFNPDKDNPEFLKFYASLNDYLTYNKIMDNENAKASKEILTNIMKRKLLKRACEFTPKDLETAADVEGTFMKMKQKDFDEVASEISESLNLKPHEVIFFRSSIKNKLFKKGEIWFRIGDEVNDFHTYSPISGRDADRFLIFGPRDKDVRKKIAQKISERFKVDLSKIAPIQ